MQVRTYGRGEILTECPGIVRNVTQVHRSPRDREDKAVVLATHTTDHHLETGKLEKKNGMDSLKKFQLRHKALTGGDIVLQGAVAS